MRTKKFKAIVIIAVFAFALLVPSSMNLYSQSQNCINQAKQSLIVVAKTLIKVGFSLNGTTPRVGALREGQAATFQTLLMRGNQYAFVVAGGCVHGVELYIFDENKRLLGQYNQGKPFAAVKVNPQFTGKVTGVVKVTGSTEDPSVVVQLMGWKKL